MRPVAQIAQSVEQGIENPRVGGSIPSLGTTFSIEVVFTSLQRKQKTRLVRVFCFLRFPTVPLQAQPRVRRCSSIWKPIRTQGQQAHLVRP